MLRLWCSLTLMLGLVFSIVGCTGQLGLTILGAGLIVHSGLCMIAGAIQATSGRSVVNAEDVRDSQGP